MLASVIAMRFYIMGLNIETFIANFIQTYYTSIVLGSGKSKIEFKYFFYPKYLIFIITILLHITVSFIQIDLS